MRVSSVLLLPVFLLFSLPTTAGVIKGPGDPPPPVHELLAELEGDFSGLQEQTDPRFGFSVAMYGDTLAVGAPGTRVGNIENRGVVFVFRKIGGAWVQTQRLAPGGGSGQDQCGYSVAVDAFNLLVGCPFHVQSGQSRGRARLYSRSSLSADFESSETFTDLGEISGSQCGLSVALMGVAESGALPLAAVGCPGRGFDGGGGIVTRPGAVDIYSWFFGWTHADSIGSGNPTPTNFGNSITFSRQRDDIILAIGRPGTTNGQAVVYRMGATVNDWNLEQTFTGPVEDSQFGHSVHMRFGRLVIGAPTRTVPLPGPGGVPTPTPVGSFTVAYRVCPINNPCSWFGSTDEFLGVPLTQPPPAAQNRLGQSVQMLASDRVAAGESEWHITDLGRARHYQLIDSDWELNENEPFYEEITWATTAEFGTSMAGDRGWLAIGAPGDVVPDEGRRGRVYLYAYDNDLFSDRFEE